MFSMCCFSCGGTTPNRYSLRLLNESWNRRPFGGDKATRELEIATLTRWTEMCENDRGDEVAREMRRILTAAVAS